MSILDDIKTSNIYKRWYECHIYKTFTAVEQGHNHGAISRKVLHRLSYWSILMALFPKPIPNVRSNCTQHENRFSLLSLSAKFRKEFQKACACCCLCCLSAERRRHPDHTYAYRYSNTLATNLANMDRDPKFTRGGATRMTNCWRDSILMIILITA